MKVFWAWSLGFVARGLPESWKVLPKCLFIPVVLTCGVYLCAHPCACTPVCVYTRVRAHPCALAILLASSWHCFHLYTYYLSHLVSAAIDVPKSPSFRFHQSTEQQCHTELVRRGVDVLARQQGSRKQKWSPFSSRSHPLKFA